MLDNLRYNRTIFEINTRNENVSVIIYIYIFYTVSSSS